MSLKRSSFTLPPALLDDLKYVADRVGVSRSALLADLLAEPLGQLRELLEKVPPAPTPEDVKRFRGESAVVVQDRLEQLRGMADDLFSGLD